LNRLPLHKLFWIVAAIAAMFLFAPGTASAHESFAPPRTAIHAAHDLHGSIIRLASAEAALASISAIAPSIEKSEPSRPGQPLHRRVLLRHGLLRGYTRRERPRSRASLR
jgi:hypothetical protein